MIDIRVPITEIEEYSADKIWNIIEPIATKHGVPIGKLMNNIYTSPTRTVFSNARREAIAHMLNDHKQSVRHVANMFNVAQRLVIDIDADFRGVGDTEWKR